MCVCLGGRRGSGEGVGFCYYKSIKFFYKDENPEFTFSEKNTVIFLDSTLWIAIFCNFTVLLQNLRLASNSYLYVNLLLRNRFLHDRKI